MNFIRRFLCEVGAELAIKEYAEKNPERMCILVEEVRRNGYPETATEREDILWDEFSRTYGIPRNKGKSVGKRDYRN